MPKVKKILSMILATLFTALTMLSYTPVQAASKAVTVPQVRFASAPVTEYTVGDRVNFNIFAPNYGGRVEYRVVLWNDSMKTYYDLWNPGNGYPTRYYSKWQPYGNNIFTLGWIINEPGSYRITVYAKRAGISNDKTALRGLNCDSYMESVAFRVKPRDEVVAFLPIPDVTVNQGTTPILPATVKAVLSDGTERTLKVSWGVVNTSTMGTFVIAGTVEGTTKKASLRLIVNQAIFSPDGVYLVEAVNSTSVNVKLRNEISFVPNTVRFTIRDSQNSSVRVSTLTLSTDKKTIQLSTDFMMPGKTYILTIDGRDYSFVIPYGSGGSTVTIEAKKCLVSVGDTVEPDIDVYPYNAQLYFESANRSIATVDDETGEIKGISSGKTTIYVYAKVSGYVAGYTTFEVEVYSAQIPSRTTSYAEVQDNNDGTATITVYVRDEDNDPINDLTEDDFEIELDDDTYEIGYRSPFDDFDFIRNGKYEFVYTPDDVPADEYIDIVVCGKSIIRNLNIEVDEGEDDDAPELVDVTLRAKRLTRYTISAEEEDLSDGIVNLLGVRKNDEFVSLKLELTDDNLDTENVEAVIEAPDEGEDATCAFAYDEDTETWELEIEDGYKFLKVGTYRITATFMDTLGNELDVVIRIKVTS